MAPTAAAHGDPAQDATRALTCILGSIPQKMKSAASLRGGRCCIGKSTRTNAPGGARRIVLELGRQVFDADRGKGNVTAIAATSATANVV